MNRDTNLLFTGLFLGIGVLGLMFLFLKHINNEFVTAQKQAYQECKARTQDLEWCFKQFKPDLNN